MFFKLGFSTRKAEQHLNGMELQENEEDEDETHIIDMIRKSPKITDASYLQT